MLFIATPAMASGPSRFAGLGDLEGGVFSSMAQAISGDGLVPVGVSDSNGSVNPDEGFRWTSDAGIQGLGSGSGLPISGAHAADADGDVIVGSGRRPSGLAEAFRWTPGSLKRIGVLDPDLGFSRAMAVSDDGGTIAGYSGIGSVGSTHAVRWPAGGTIESLGASPPSQALGISGDGRVIAGFLTRDGVERAMRWTQETGAFELTPPGDPDAPSRATASDATGEVLVGWSGAEGARTAWRWTAAGTSDLAALPGAVTSEALAVSGDGRVVVGSSGGRAFRWDRDHGMQDVKSLLELAGVDVTGWQLLAARGVADDGRTLTGTGIDPLARNQGWIAVVVPRDEDPRPEMAWHAVQSGSGNSHSCGVLANGSAACWGADDYGQSDPPGGVFAQVVTGDQHSCGLRFDGDVECWGRNQLGQAPASVPGPFRSLAAGASHTCGVLRSSGRASCWGADGEGQSTLPAALEQAVFLDLSAGEAHTCGRLADRSVACWGRGANGSGARQATPRTGPFRAIDLGANHSCGLRDTGAVACWGENGAGQRNPPTGVVFRAVSAGGLHTCGVASDRSVRCWGSNAAGQAAPPAGVFESVSAGGFHSCGRRPGGAIECWGSDDDGESSPPGFPVPQLGAGADFSCAVQPTGRVECWGDATSYAGLPDGSFSRVAAGLASACGLRTDGGVSCFGSDSNGNTGAPAAAAFVDVALADAVTCGVRDTQAIQCWGFDDAGSEQSPPGGFSQISAGPRHFCALRGDGQVLCWGDAPGGVPPLAFRQVAAGGAHDCAIRADDGGVVCWGNDDFGQLSAPVGSFVALSAGAFHTCGIRTGGALACWGRGLEGQLAAPSGAFVDLAAGFAHACAVRAGGAITCWGLGDEGQTAPPGDDDADGIASLEDGCPLVPDADQADADGDGVGDACDVCPSRADPFQLDTDVDATTGLPDPDGVGDYCDVCPAVHDPDQETDASGAGLACAGTRLFYEVIPAPAPSLLGPFTSAVTGASIFDVQLDCGASARVGEVAIGLVFPAEISEADVTVGGGCEGPSLIGGHFCNAASTDPTVLGATVDRTQSWTAGPGAPPLGPAANPEAVYLRFVGLPNGGSPRLCTQGQTVLLARVEVTGLANAALAPPFTVQGLDEILVGLAPLPAVSSDGNEIDSTTIELASGSQSPKVTLRVEPHGSDPMRWLVLLDADVNVEVLRFALSGFTGVTPQQLRLAHCNTTSATDPTLRTCAVTGGPPDPPSDWPVDVDEAFSYTRGPSTALVTRGGRGDTLYVEVAGSAPAGLGFTLNPGLATAHVATVYFDPPAGSSLTQPYITYQGVREVLGGDPVIPTFATDSVTDADLAARGSFALPLDFDGDGFVNEFDKCQFVAEAFQLDTGGVESLVNLLGQDPDGIGNACQCGDTRGLLASSNPPVNDGKVVSDDARGIQEILVGLDTDPAIEDRASTQGAVSVDLKDWLTLELNRQGLGAGVGPACVPASPGG